MIRIEKLNFFYEAKKLFDDFCVEIPDNSLVSIKGESGKGKTTLLNILAGFEIPFSGEIYFDDIILSKENIFKIRQEIGWLPQNFNMPIDTVKELFMAPFDLKFNKKYLPDDTEIKSLFESLNLQNIDLQKKTDEISGGQKQRVLLASLLATQKPYLLLDEPSSALDNKSVEMLMNLLKKENKTVIISTHDQMIIEKSSLVIDLDKMN